jgi:microsomal dipeptidase-like Zn-dependent dipeptidase
MLRGLMMSPAPAPPALTVFDGPQYCAWTPAILDEMAAGGVACAHVTIAYHETFREACDRLTDWNRLFARHGTRIGKARRPHDIARHVAAGRTAILLGAQNPSVLDGDLGLVEALSDLGLSFLQITYNNQSLLGSGWQEPVDGGLTRFGRQVLAELNRLGMVADLSHAGERTTIETIEASARPVCVSHANPRWFRDTARNVSDRVIDALAGRDGLLGLSLYPHHLKDGSGCTLADFTAMVARLAERIGVQRIGLGSDLCQGQPDSVVRWMREGRWTFETSDPPARFPESVAWFASNRDFPGIAMGLRKVGFSDAETAAIMGGNWHRFLNEALLMQAGDPLAA